MSESTKRWTSVALGEVFNITIGRTPKRSESIYWGTGHPWLSVGDMRYGGQLSSTKEQITDAALNGQSGRLVMPGTTVMSFKLSIGKVGVVSRPMYTNEAIAAFEPKYPGRVDPMWLQYALLALDFSGSSNRATMGGTLNKKSLAALKIPFPPFDEQRRIAAILGKAAETTGLQESRLGILDKYASAITQDALAEADTTIELGELLTRIDSGKSPVCEDRAAGPGEWAVLKLGAISSGIYRPEENKALKSETTPSPDLEVSPGDLLFSRKNTRELVGATALVYDTPAQLMLPDLIFRLVPSAEAPVESAYLHAVLNAPQVRRRLAELAGGSAASMVNISKAKLQKFEVPLPTMDVQRRLADQLRSVHELRTRQHHQLTHYLALSESLQSRAFRGEL